MSNIQPEVTLHSEMAFDGKLVHVRRDTVRLPNGRESVREIVEHQPVIAVLPRLEDGRLVMVRQFRKAAERVLLEVPAGGIDGDETPEEAVEREMIEETGYRVGRTRHLASFYTSPGFCNELMHLYEATGLTPGTATEEDDQIEVVLMTPEEALRHMQDGNVADAKTLLALTYAR